MAARLLIALVSTLALVGGGYWWGHTATDNAWQAKHAKELEAERAETAKETKRADQAAANYLQEHLDQEDRHAALNKPGTLFYVDPPYWDCENDYGVGLFGTDDFARLAALLGAVKGKFILSLNDTPGVRETFSAFHIEALKTRYSISGTKKQEAAEVLISNFR